MPLFVLLAILIPGTAFAQASGACSNHGGVDCLAGPDTDGSVICIDGWDLSSVDYKDVQDVCLDDFTPFDDVTELHKNYTAIIDLYVRGIIQGYPDGSFMPNNSINRAEFVKILVESIGQRPNVNLYHDCFPDVGTAWYAPYVCYAKSKDWVQGYPDGDFKPDNRVNDVEAIKMLLEIQGFDVPMYVNTAPFTDVSINQWYAPYVSVAKDYGLLEKTGTVFNPGTEMTRANITEMTYRAIVVVENNLDTFTDF